MFKKMLIASAILAASSSAALAASAPALYLGPSIGLVNNTSDNNPAYRGIHGNLALGYGGIVSPNVYLAAEFFGEPGSFKVSGNTLLKSKWGFGLSLIPGWYFSDKTMGYLRVGAIGTRFSQGNVTKAGGQLGVGLQTNVCQNWDIRGEYVWSKYGSFSGISSPNSDAFNLGLIYKFE